MTLLGAALSRHAVERPANIAIDPGDAAPIAYADLLALVADRVKGLRDASETGCPATLQMDHGASAVLAELAMLEAGIPVLSLPGFFTAEQSRHAISVCGARDLSPPPPVDKSHGAGGGTVGRTALSPIPTGTARITFTSGSTGTPKGICLSAEHMLTVAATVASELGTEHTGRHLAVLPPGILLETVAGLFATLLAGGAYVAPPQAHIGLADPFRPDFPVLARAIADLRITSLILVPEYLAGLVGVLEAHGLRLPELTIVAVGGARVPPGLIARALALGLPVRQGYGLTETGSVVALEPAGDPDGIGSVGRPLPHMRATIAPDGEVMLAGPLFLGAIGAPESPQASPPESPFATGDLGRIDAAGRLWIEGRKSNLIVTGYGRNVSPEWVEEALLGQPGVLQAMVWGDGLPAPRALLVAGDPDVDLAAAVAAANARLPAYAQVAGWQEVAPFTPDNGLLSGNGKLRRRAIHALWLEHAPAYFDELEAATWRDRLRFLAIPQVRAGLAGTISREAYLAYLTQAWHHVRHTVPLLAAAREALRERAGLAAALDAYIDEETGHDEWILADIAAAGGDADAARHSPPAPATSAMVAHAYERIRGGSPVSLFGMVYVLESISVALAQRGALAVAGRLGLPPEAFTYLTSHGELDRDHVRFFAQLVNGLDAPADRAAITGMAKVMFGLFGAVFATIPLETSDASA